MLQLTIFQILWPQSNVSPLHLSFFTVFLRSNVLFKFLSAPCWFLFCCRRNLCLCSRCCQNIFFVLLVADFPDYGCGNFCLVFVLSASLLLLLSMSCFPCDFSFLSNYFADFFIFSSNLRCSWWAWPCCFILCDRCYCNCCWILVFVALCRGVRIEFPYFKIFFLL